jgi:hypothetical protein
MLPSLELISSSLGLAGSLLLAVPFFSDFLVRCKRHKRIHELGDGTFSREDAAELRDPVEKIGTDAVLEADARMALLASIGCALLVLSFALQIIAGNARG